MSRSTRSTLHTPAVYMTHTHTHHTQAYYSEAEVAQVNVPGLTGDFGILPSHVPVLTCLKPGVISVYADAAGTPEDYFVSSGTFCICTEIYK